jgi:hypothetical protein
MHPNIEIARGRVRMSNGTPWILNLAANVGAVVLVLGGIGTIVTQFEESSRWLAARLNVISKSWVAIDSPTASAQKKPGANFDLTCNYRFHHLPGNDPIYSASTQIVPPNTMIYPTVVSSNNIRAMFSNIRIEVQSSDRDTINVNDFTGEGCFIHEGGTGAKTRVQCYKEYKIKLEERC